MQQKNNLVIPSLTFAIIVGGVAWYALANTQTPSNPSASTQPAAQSSPPPPTPASSASSSVSSSAYRDGTYTAQGTYQSPGGTQHVTVSLTIAHDTVTGASVTEGAADPTSRRYQGLFVSGYKQYVVGKPLVSLSLSQVSGSSLTSQGFNDAVAKIEAQAQQ